MADFTDFTWETGDYGEASKFNAMVDNDRHLRQRTDFHSHHWATSPMVNESGTAYSIRLGGTEIASGAYSSSSPDHVAHVNIDLSAISGGLLNFQVYTNAGEVLSGRVYKHADIGRASVWLTFVRVSGDPNMVYVRNVSLILHRQWQSW